MRIFLPLLLIACTTENTEPDALGGQFGEETSGCQITSETALDLDEVSDLGFSADDVLAFSEGAHASTVAWADGSDSPITVTVSNPTDARREHYEYVSDDGIEIGCPSTLSIDVDLSIVSDDGLLDESIAATLAVDASMSAAISWDLGGLAGTLDPADYTTASFDDTWATLRITFVDEGGMSGALDGYGESASGSGDSATVSLTTFEIGRF